MSLTLLCQLSRKLKNPLLTLNLQTHYFSTAAFYDDLVITAGLKGDYESLISHLNNRFYQGCFNTSNTFKFLTNTQNSISSLQTLIQTLSKLDHGYARKGAFDALVARLCKLDRVDEASKVLAVMARENYGINALSFHPLLNALCRKKEMESAWRVLDVMRGYSIAVDVTSFNYILTGYCFNGNVKGACKVLEVMESDGLSGDTRTYDALVLGACRAGKVEGALRVLRRMEDDGLPVLYSTHVHVINAMLNKGYYAQAVKFVMIYGGRDRALDEDNCGTLASKLIGLKRFDEAKAVLEEMRKLGLRFGPKLTQFYESQFQ